MPRSAQGETADALALFRRNVEANPYSANAWDSLADGCDQAGKWQEAADAADRAAALATETGDPNLSYFEAQAGKLAARAKEESAAPVP